MSLQQPETANEVVAIVAESQRVVCRGGGTKTALHLRAADGGRLSDEGSSVTELQLSGMNRVIEYEPTEFTITAQAGAPLSLLVETLGENGQYLPFDPPLVAQGATLGGAVASGLSGPGRLRYGGLRDFVLGVQWVDGTATLVRGGGKVVKNAAGFDFPKLLVGSCGWLGCLTEITLKVFPQAVASRTGYFAVSDAEQALRVMATLTTSGFDLDAVEYQPAVEYEPGIESSDEVLGKVWVRLAGEVQAIEASVSRMETQVGVRLSTVEEAEAASFWAEGGCFGWCPEGAWLVRVPVTLSSAERLLAWCAERGVVLRVGVAGNIVWMAWPAERAWRELDEVLSGLGLGGLLVRCPTELAGEMPSAVRLGEIRSQQFWERVKGALDPQNRFGDWRL